MSEIIHQFVYESWPWYIGGPLIGLFAISLLILERKALGISISFEQICSLPRINKKNRTALLSDPWQIWFVVGMIIGGIILVFFGFTTNTILLSKNTTNLLSQYGITDFSGYVPNELFQFSFPQLFILIFGGLLIGFGSRYAGGCTAGHAIMGVSQLAPSSIITTVGFFVGGLISTYFIVPYLLSL